MGQCGGVTSKSLISGRRFRLLKVYRTVAVVLASYMSLRLVGLVRGREWYEAALLRCHHRTARRVRNGILEVRGLFIKVGQLISILTNFLPAEFRADLEGLQDEIPPRPLAEIEGRLRRELGQEGNRQGGIASLFASFNETPIASASLAQVHEARLHDGRRVAVKVQHLDIEELAGLDLKTIRNILSIVQFVLRVRGLTTAFEEIREMILEELDFEKEAEHIEAISAHFADGPQTAGDPGVSFPSVIPERSTRRVLTTTFVSGVKISDLEALKERGIDPQDIAERVVRAYCQMIFVDGHYHADPHPGNILVQDDGGLVFLDFGAVSKLSPALKDGIAKFTEGILRRDQEEILRALRHMGFVSQGDERDTAERVIQYCYSRFLEQIELDSWNLKDIRFDTQMKFEMMADLSRLDISISELTSTFQVPKEWVLLQRTLVLLMGLATHLHPEMRPITILRPYLEEFVLGQDHDWKGMASRAVKDMALSVLTIPDDLKRLLAQARRGDARLEIGGLRESAGLIYALGHQLLYGAFAMATGILTYVAWIRGDDFLVRVLAAASGFFLLCLGGSLLKARKWRRRLNSPARTHTFRSRGKP